MSKSNVCPSALLKRLIVENPDATNPQLADLFAKQFPLVRSTAKRAIWRWGRGKDIPNSLNDEQIDSVLREFLKDAGYM